MVALKRGVENSFRGHSSTHPAANIYFAVASSLSGDILIGHSSLMGASVLLILLRCLLILHPWVIAAAAAQDEANKNVLIIVLDQLRFDALGFVQSRLSRYDGKLHVRSPNIDSLARDGVAFSLSYSPMPLCAPSRASIKTGCLVARHAVTSNSAAAVTKMKVFRDRSDSTQTYEEVFHRDLGYRVETYGKWHFLVNNATFYSTIDSNTYDYQTKNFGVEESDFTWYRNALQVFGVNETYQQGDQTNPISQQPYSPFQLDPLYGYPTKSTLRASSPFYGDPGTSRGRDSLDANQTLTGVLGDIAQRALSRLVRTGDPFMLSVHFNSPHPPMVSTGKYLDYYWENRSQIFIPPSIGDSMKGSAYALSNQRKFKKGMGSSYGYDDPDQIAQVSAAYYGMIEEVDYYVGRLVKQLRDAGQWNNTLILLTSDHGELLGSHGMMGKSNLLEESARVPLILSLPGTIPEGRVVNEPVSLVDVYATLLDYGGNVEDTYSDGSSLRRFVERTSFNELYDERVVVIEWDGQQPASSTKLSGKLGNRPNFMVRKGNYKLMIPRKADSKVVDMLYDLGSDPYEMRNLLANPQSDDYLAAVAKAEHLKILLLEFLQRHDGTLKIYSSNKYHLGEGTGDIDEVRRRCTWKKVAYWQSTQKLSFGAPSLIGGVYRRVEYLYFGSTKGGDLVVQNVTVRGGNAKYFTVSQASFPGYVRVRVSFQSQVPVTISSLNVKVVVHNSVRGQVRIPIVGEDWWETTQESGVNQ